MPTLIYYPALIKLLSSHEKHNKPSSLDIKLHLNRLAFWFWYKRDLKNIIKHNDKEMHEMPLPMLTVGGSPSHHPQDPSRLAQGWRGVCSGSDHAQGWGKVENGWWRSCWPAWRAVGWGWGRDHWWGVSYASPYCPEERTSAASDSRRVFCVTCVTCPLGSALGTELSRTCCV